MLHAVCYASNEFWIHCLLLVASWFLFQACRGSYSKHTIGLLVFINQSKWPEFGQSRQSLWHPIPDPQLLNHCSQLIPILNVLIPELNQQHIACFLLKLGPCGPSWPQSGRLFDLLITLKLCASLIWLQLCPNMDILCAWSFLVGYNPDNLDTNCCNLLLPPPPPYFAFFSLMQEASCLYLSQCTILCTYIY
jgi:hypothetical protein